MAHGHTAGSPALATATALAPASLAHAHVIGVPALGQFNSLAPAALAHVHALGVPTVISGAITQRRKSRVKRNNVQTSRRPDALQTTVR